MKKVQLFKMPFDNKTFRQNQKVFVVYWPGGSNALCCGRNRGKGRWITRWVNWTENTVPSFIDVDMPNNSRPVKAINKYKSENDIS